MTDFKTFAYDENDISSNVSFSFITSTFPSITYIHELQENCAQRNTYLWSRNLAWSDILPAIFQSNFIENEILEDVCACVKTMIKSYHLLCVFSMLRAECQ